MFWKHSLVKKPKGNIDKRFGAHCPPGWLTPLKKMTRLEADIRVVGYQSGAAASQSPVPWAEVSQH